MVTLVIAAALLCLSLPVAFVAALYYNDQDARRAERGIDDRMRLDY